MGSGLVGLGLIMSNLNLILGVLNCLYLILISLLCLEVCAVGAEGVHD